MVFSELNESLFFCTYVWSELWSEIRLKNLVFEFVIGVFFMDTAERNSWYVYIFRG